VRAVEFFSGIGGWRYALGKRGTILRAYDISPAANDTYAHNHGSRPWDREIASLDPLQLEGLQADTWFMSPPCQPFCRMGNQRGLEDLRSRAFLHLMALLERVPPQHLVLENVSGFLGSDAYGLLRERLSQAGLACQEYHLCPTQFGIPNLRPRFFLVASRSPLATPVAPWPMEPRRLGSYLDPEEEATLYLSPGERAKHEPGLALATADSVDSACFIGGYGKRFVGSGAFLRTPEGIRRFSPREIARLLGLPQDFQFPGHISQLKQYKLLGNGLSIPVAQWVLDALTPRPPC